MEDLYKEYTEVPKYNSYICVIVGNVKYYFEMTSCYEFISPLTGEIVNNVQELEKHIEETLEEFPDLVK